MQRYKIGKLPLVVQREGKHFVAYSPALDLATSARTHDKALERFAEAVQIFFEELDDLGTTDEVLSDLGWQRIGGESKPPPVVFSELVDVPLHRRRPLGNVAKARSR